MGGKADPSALEVKFRDDTPVSALDGHLTFADSSAQARFDALIGKASVGALFTVASPSKIDTQRAALEAKGKDVPDLTTWFQVKLPAGSDAGATLQKLQSDPLVEHALVTPVALPTTSVSAGDQTGLTNSAAVYLGTGPAGMNILAQASVPGALGDDIDTDDIEYAWNETHEDLMRTSASEKGSMDTWYYPGVDPYTDEFHGTAVASTQVAKRGNGGVDGIAPNAHFHGLGITSPGLQSYPAGGPGNGAANAIYTAAQRSPAGSVMTIEIGSFAGGPAEGDNPVVADALRWATQHGIIVIESAGNGSVNLDTDPNYSTGSVRPGITSSSPDFSGAIIVGGGETNCYGKAVARDRAPYSSYGSRVDAQAAGWCVASASSSVYPEWAPFSWDVGTGANGTYSTLFDGTSSATAVMGGFVAALSGAYTAATGQALTPALARATVMNVANGQAQATGTGTNGGHIGPLPDLGKAIAAIAKGTPRVTPGDAPEAGAVNSAILRGTVNSAGLATTTRIEWGPTTSYGTTTAAASVAAGVSKQVAVVTDSLTTGALYHYRTVATNSLGTVYGPDQTFTIGAPRVTPGDAPSPGAVGSTILRGTVDSAGLATTTKIEWGTTTSYGSSTTAASVAAGVTKQVAVVTNTLPAGTLYHYRTVATNTAGTTYGADQTFTGSGVPVVSNGDAPVRLHSAAVYLHGLVDPSASTTTVHVEYGPTTSYGTSTINRTIVAGSPATNVGLVAGLLSYATTYHYRFVAINDRGTTYGADQMFSINTGAPFAYAGPDPVHNASGSWTLSGRVDSDGLATTTTIEWGPTKSYGASVSAASVAAGTTKTVAISTSSLAPNSWYHYRVVATNASGTTAGPDQAVYTG